MLRRSSRVLRFFFRVVPLQHRGWTHTGLALLLVTLLQVRLALPVGWPFVVGYVSHVVMDMMTFSGVPVLAPLVSRSFHVLPKAWRFGSLSNTDKAIYFVGSLALFFMAAWVWMHMRGGMF